MGQDSIVGKEVMFTQKISNEDTILKGIVVDKINNYNGMASDYLVQVNDDKINQLFIVYYKHIKSVILNIKETKSTTDTYTLPHNFLHSHTGMERQLLKDNEHIIVDKEDYLIARELLHLDDKEKTAREVKTILKNESILSELFLSLIPKLAAKTPEKRAKLIQNINSLADDESLLVFDKEEYRIHMQTAVLEIAKEAGFTSETDKLNISAETYRWVDKHEISGGSNE